MRERMPAYAVSSPDTSTSVLPLPRAMRRRRAGVFASSSGCSRSWEDGNEFRQRTRGNKLN